MDGQKPESAPKYSWRERFKIWFGATIACGLLLVLSGRLILPLDEETLCRPLFWYGLFIAPPLSTLLLLLVALGPTMWRTLRSGQFPPPGQKVLRLTRYVYGFRARIRVFVYGIALACLVGLSVQGYFWAKEAQQAFAKFCRLTLGQPPQKPSPDQE